MISFDSDLYTCFPKDDLNSECRSCGEKILVKVDEDGFVKTSHVEQKKCNHTNISQNCISYLIHTLTNRPYPRPMSKCLSCFDDIVYMWTNINYAKWLHTNLFCSNVFFVYQTEEFARILIINHLVNGGRIAVKTECHSCNRFYRYKIPKLTAVDKNPYFMMNNDMMNVDIGCIGANNFLIGIIQVTLVNYDDYKKFIRAGLFFYEFSPEEVIKKLDSINTKICTFINRKCIRCKNK